MIKSPQHSLVSCPAFYLPDTVILCIQRRCYIDDILLLLLSVIDMGVSEKTNLVSAVLSLIPKYGDWLYFAATLNAYSACHFYCFCKHLDSWQSTLV